MKTVNAPWGIQVERTESLRLRLLKAVLIPMTIKYFLFKVDLTFFKSSDIIGSFIIVSRSALAATIFISKSEMALSRVLHSMYSNKLHI